MLELLNENIIKQMKTNSCLLNCYSFIVLINLEMLLFSLLFKMLKCNAINEFYVFVNRMASGSKKSESHVDSSKNAVGDHFRRTWDKDLFEEKARQRLEEDLALLTDDLVKKPITDEVVKREKLKARDYQVDLSSKLGKSQVITKTTPLQEQGGYYCNVCDCVVKDSINFLDHINGKKHQRNLGMSMKVERSTLEQVKNRFMINKRKKEEEEKQKDYDFDARIKELEEEVGCSLTLMSLCDLI